MAFTRYSFTHRLLCMNQTSLYSSRPPALATPLRYYCTTIGQYTSPPPTPLLHAIHYTVLVITISCKGQGNKWGADQSGGGLYKTPSGTSSSSCEKGLRGCARCVVPGVSAAVATAAWLGRAFAVGVRKLLGGLDVGPCGIVCRSLCG